MEKLYNVFDDIHADLLPSSIDLQWADAENCAFYVAVRSKEIPMSDDLPTGKRRYLRYITYFLSVNIKTAEIVETFE